MFSTLIKYLYFYIMSQLQIATNRYFYYFLILNLINKRGFRPLKVFDLKG